MGALRGPADGPPSSLLEMAAMSRGPLTLLILVPSVLFPLGVTSDGHEVSPCLSFLNCKSLP